ncbi:MAG: LysM peptidoglycan-binding domain-containing M23 family metallopeptidase [Anaerolineae bacterium]|nr:LysM peptidoglycan-binding domain-containing M23 family metallopeptidase [Anaerolineae bacterium]
MEETQRNQPGIEITPTVVVVDNEQNLVAQTSSQVQPTVAPGDLDGSPTPYVPPMPIPTPASDLYTYHTVANGESLTYLADVYGTEIETLVKMNNLSGPSALIHIDQVLRVPLDRDKTSPDSILLPDSEVVYSPGYVEFDIAEFVESQEGYLVEYTEWVDNQYLSGAEIIELVAEQYSVGPRLLLALLEYYGGWVTNETLTEYQIQAMLGDHNPRGGSLYLALAFTANRINDGYYGYKRDGFWVFHLPDYNQAVTPGGLNAGTVGVQNILSLHSDWDTWHEELKPDGFMATYRDLFGDPAAYEVRPVVPKNLTQPELSLPWQEGKSFYFTSGPHPGFVDGSAWAAIDFGPPDVLGSCFYSEEPITAAADGVVVMARNGEVYLDLDGDGNIQTGWVLFYLHAVADIDIPISKGQHLKQGDIIGYASCEGGLSNSSHLHFARRYNGEWMDAGGPVPMNLSGWEVQNNLVPYNGKLVKDDEVREACECWEPDMNLIVNSDD